MWTRHEEESRCQSHLVPAIAAHLADGAALEPENRGIQVGARHAMRRKYAGHVVASGGMLAVSLRADILRRLRYVIHEQVVQI